MEGRRDSVGTSSGDAREKASPIRFCCGCGSLLDRVSDMDEPLGDAEPFFPKLGADSTLTEGDVDSVLSPSACWADDEELSPSTDE